MKKKNVIILDPLYKIFTLCLQFEPELPEEADEELEEANQEENGAGEDAVLGQDDDAARAAMPPPPPAGAGPRGLAPHPTLPRLERGGGAPIQRAPLYRESPVEVSTKVVFS
jgi:hypothetical protein